jgi:hypothetical protein
VRDAPFFAHLDARGVCDGSSLWRGPLKYGPIRKSCRKLVKLGAKIKISAEVRIFKDREQEKCLNNCKWFIGAAFIRANVKT